VTVNPLPSAIIGAFSVCTGLTTTLANATSGGGTWSSSTPAVATVDISTGVVTGVIGGTTTITFTSTLTSCTSTAVVTVYPSPTAISGPGVVCTSLTITLSDG